MIGKLIWKFWGHKVRNVSDTELRWYYNEEKNSQSIWRIYSVTQHICLWHSEIFLDADDSNEGRQMLALLAWLDVLRHDVCVKQDRRGEPSLMPHHYFISRGEYITTVAFLRIRPSFDQLHPSHCILLAGFLEKEGFIVLMGVCGKVQRVEITVRHLERITELCCYYSDSHLETPQHCSCLQI